MDNFSFIYFLINIAHNEWRCVSFFFCCSSLGFLSVHLYLSQVKRSVSLQNEQKRNKKTKKNITSRDDMESQIKICYRCRFATITYTWRIVCVHTRAKKNTHFFVFFSLSWLLSLSFGLQSYTFSLLFFPLSCWPYKLNTQRFSCFIFSTQVISCILRDRFRTDKKYSYKIQITRPKSNSNQFAKI